MFKATNYGVVRQGIKISINDILFGIFIVLLSFSSIFSVSGFAVQIKYNITIAFIVAAGFIFYLLINIKTLNIKLKHYITLYIIIIIFLIYELLAFKIKDENQVVNLLNFGLFLVLIIAFSKFKWSKNRIEISSYFLTVYNVFILRLLSPGKLLEGWNANSPILVLYGIFFCICSLYFIEKFWGKVFVIIGIALSSFYIYSLNNRSGFISIIALITILYLFKIISFSRNKLRTLYITCFSFNYLATQFSAYFTKTDIGMYINQKNNEIFQKEFLSGRDLIWDATYKIDNIYIGNSGIRSFYSHNLSTDIIQSFGIVGMLIYYITLYNIMDKVYNTKNAKINIFTVSFSVILFLNTFENVLFSNNSIIVFQYVFLAIPLMYKFNKY